MAEQDLKELRLKVLRKRVEEQRATEGQAEIAQPKEEPFSASKPIKQALSAITAPIVAASEAIDPYTGAPVRAAVGEAQRGGSLKKIAQAGAKQLVAGEVLPTTPSGEEIVFQEQKRLGIPKEFAKKSSEVLGPVAGAVLDLTNFIPSAPILKTAGATAKFSSEAVGLAGKAAKAGGMKAAETFLKAGEVITLGNLESGKALKAAKNLSGMELLFPGNIKVGRTKEAAKKIAKMREWLSENPVVVPGSRDALSKVRTQIADASGRTISTPNAKAVLDFIDKKLEPKIITETIDGVPVQKEIIEDLKLNEIDDVIGNLDITLFTGLGNPRALNRFWGPVLRESRRELDKVLQTVPEGQLFKNAKSKFEDLATAGKNRSKLMETVSIAGFVGGIFDPTALALRFLSPKTYMQVIGLAKLPSDSVDLLRRAGNSGKAELIRDSLAFIAKDHPVAAEKIVRGAFLASGKESDLEEIDFKEKLQGLKIPERGLSIPRR